MTLLGVEVVKGDRVQLTTQRRLTQINSTNQFTIEPTEVFEVSSAYTGDVIIRTIDRKSVPRNWANPEMRRVSFRVRREWLQLEDPNRPQPRRLGQKPEDTDDMIYVPINHPGLQWLFDDMGRYADEQGYCSQYDALTARLGIPGRPRDFNVTHTINGITVSAVIQARSQKEAKEQLAKALGATEFNEE